MNSKTRFLMLILAGIATQATAAGTAIQCTEFTDAATGKLLIREGQCDKRITPASTFKIAISLMGYDSGILRDEHTPTLPFRKGYIDWQASWRAPTDPTAWMKNSVVWYSQQITAILGEAQFQRYVKDFNYGNYDVSGDPGKHNSLTFSWINSSLKISPDEQVTFLRGVVNRTLPVSAKSYDMTAHILKLEKSANGWEIFGKTGSGHPLLPNGESDHAHAYGWFVGWATKGERTIVFVRLVQDQKAETGAAGLRVRTAFLRDLPAQLEIL